MALNPYDQSVYDAGFKYIPQSQYLLNPFKIPSDGSVENDTFKQPTGIASLGSSGGGGGFNPYNTDMSQIRTDFRPDYDFRRYSEYGMNPSTMDRKQMDMNQDYFYDRPSAMQQKIGGLMNFIPGIGTLRTVGNVIGGALKNILPENQRAIMENQARGAGIFTDDIGRIVTDDYNTAGGIMAGYNLNKIDADTVDKRRGTVMDTLGSKYGLSASQIESARNDPNYTGPGANLIDRLGLFDEFEDELDKINTKTKKILTFREKKKAKEIADKKAEEDEKLQAEIDAYNRRQAEIARRSRDSDNDGVPDYVEDAGGSAPGGIYGTDYQGDSSPSNVGGDGGSQGGGRDMGGGGTRDSGGSTGGYSYDGGGRQGFGYGLADGGRVYYMDGGRVAYMLGGLTDLVDIYD
jgi:hypothetical protein